MYNWFNIFNLTEWIATGLVSRKLTVFLQGVGQKEILITQGNETGIQVDDVFLILNFADKNPFVVGSHAVYKDEEGNVWLGFAQ